MSLRAISCCVLLLVATASFALRPMSVEAEATVADAAAQAAAAAAKPDAETADKPARTGRPVKELPTFTPEREAAALTFVAAHHPDLSPLLAGLKASRPQEYQRAVRRLFADSERLAQSREMQPKQYELKLREWQLESRVQLLVARLTMERTPALEAELRSVLEEQLTVHRELLVQERERMQQRTAALDRQISEIDADRAAAVAERFDRALNSVGPKKPGLKAGRSDDKPQEKSSAATKDGEPKKATP